jgi:para-nitrobenzyl esterase
MHVSLIAAFGGLLAALACANAVGNSPVVATEQGSFSGVDVGEVVAFRGIPYAQPPVGDRRWRPPAPPAVHTGVLPANELGKACMQTRPGLEVSEDCLYLNVWTPGLDEGERPVMVWIHGGGFRAGSGDIGGEVLAREDVVAVSFNYRLGPLGFFSHDELRGKDANFGLLDMVRALEWVKTNIGTFGGDPNNVTIFGVSAGGMAVNLLMVTPSAQGLFHRAIAQSGYATWALPRSRFATGTATLSMEMVPQASAETLASALIAGIDDALQTEASLRAVDAGALTSALKGFQLPIVDGQSLLDEPGILFGRGEQHDVPFMTGGNSNEGTVMRGSGVAVEAFANSFGDDAERVKNLYADDFRADDSRANEEAAWQRVFGDNRYLLSAHVLGASMARVASPVWLYYVDFVPAAFKDEWIGTPHGMDAFFLLQGHTSEDPAIKALASRMLGYWVNFARTGDPNGRGLLSWPAHGQENPAWLVFGHEDAIAQNVLGAKLALLTERYERRIRQ